jgi:tRNA pseudouridine38-40 synthase
MNKAAVVLMEYIDFTSFSKVNTDTKTNDCTITEAHWDRVGEGQWRFTITANRFLRNMVRAIVGTLMEVGRGRMTIEQLRQVIEAKDRCRAGDSVPGNALFLVDVKY